MPGFIEPLAYGKKLVMNRKIASALVVAAATLAGTAFAETPGTDAPFHGSYSRAQVQAELAAYKQAGVNPWSTQYNPLKTFKSAKTRDAVVAEYVASRDAVAAFTGEDSGSAYLAQGVVAPVRDTLAGVPVNAQ
jgi:hypothetical protein